MSVVIGLDVGHDAIRVAALIDDRPELVLSLPTWVAWSGDQVMVGVEARERPNRERLGRLPAWLERTADDGLGDGGAGPLTCVWPLVDGTLRAPAEALAWLLRAAVVAVEDRYGPVLGAVFAVDPSLGVVGRRALRDAAAIAGIPTSRQVAAPACAMLMVAGASDGAWLVCDAGAGGLSLAVLDLAGGASHSLVQLRDPELGGDALDAAIATQLEAGGEPIDVDDPAWPGLCAVARAIKEDAAAGELASQIAGLGSVGLGLQPPRADDVEAWLEPRFRRVDERCQRALTTAGLAAADLVDVLLIGGGARLIGLQDRLQHALGRGPRMVGDPAVTAVLGAAIAARMFLAEPAALFVEPVAWPLALSDGHGFETLVASGAVAPIRASQVVPTAEAAQERLEVELWEQGLRNRPYGRYALTGLPAAPAGDVIATCDVLVDADLVPRLTARELVSGAALTVAAVAEAAISPDALAALREHVIAWRP